MVKGMNRCTTARLRASKRRARFSEQGMSGCLWRSKTNTAITVFLPFLFPKGDPRKGLVTVLGQHSQHAPLANVPPACWAAHPARHPERAISDQRQGQELRRRSWVS